MPTLKDLGFDPDSGVMLGDIGTGAGAFPQPPAMNFIDQQNAQRRLALGPPSSGRMTWFNPKPWTYNDPATGRSWTDAQAQARREGAHASGLPISTPGFATAGRGGLGHWYEVTLPDGRKIVTQKTDIGPSGVVDLNAALASSAYPGGPQTMGGGKVSTRYIGANLPEGMTAGPMQGGWNTTVGPDAPGGGVGYVAPDRVAQGATTNPAELVKPQEASLANTLGRFFANFDFKPATPAKAAPIGFGTASPFRFTPLGQRR
jgi:hypothetical protein